MSPGGPEGAAGPGAGSGPGTGVDGTSVVDGTDVIDGTGVVDGVDVCELLAGGVDDGDDVDGKNLKDSVEFGFSLRSRFTVAAAAAPRDPPTSAMIKIAATKAPITILPTFVLQNGTTGSEGKGLVPASSAFSAESVTGVMPVEDWCSI